MGALSSFLTWNPEDDLLLKNAVEAGASLESLAKGAVQFSQRFTIRELEDRWRSLLYDLNTSTEASTRIIDIEIGVSAYNPSKPGRACNSKVKETSSGRRKGESLQSHYHTTRKKARSELPKSVKSGFLMSPSSHAGNDGSSHDHLKLKSEFSLSKFHVDVPFSDNYGHPEASCGGGQHIYGKMAKVESTAAASSLAFHGGNLGSIEAKLPVGFSGTDCLYRHGENISSIPIDEAGYNDAGDNFESNLTPKDFPHALDRNHCSSQTSNVPGSTPTFHQLGYSSPSRSLPIWKTVEDVSTPTLQMDEQFKVKCQGVVTGQCIEKIDDQACDNVTPKSKLSNDTSTDALNNSAIMLDANFIDFNNPGMCFTVEEELLLIDVDEVDIGDGSCLNGLSSMFLSSPTSTNMDNLAIPAEPKPSEAFVIPTCKDADNSVEDGTIHEQIHDGTTDLHRSDVPVVCALSSSSGASPTTASVEKLMICVLNTEDQDIPRNDDVPFPAKLFQAFPNSNLRQDISSTMAYYGKATSGDSSLVKEGIMANVQPNVPNCKAGHSLLPKVGLLHSTVDSRIESVSPERDLICGASNLSNKDMDVPSLIPAITSQTAPDLSLKQDTATELNMQVACMPSHPDLVSSELGFVDPFPAMSISDQEELFENEDDDDYDDDDDDDDDIPNSSDVEAMILGMDLGPYDQESCLFAKEVSRYQCMETKKTIIRLEQGARSYMNRAISSHGAFAIFYGRKLKYFIRNPTVLLGRETGEIKVDIDLAIEGRANQISRRQAIIKMDEDGYFLLRNIGKCSIFVNSKEVPFKKRINLCSCALIEIRDMRFIFEVSEVAVRRHIASSRQIRHGPKSEFDFVYR